MAAYRADIEIGVKGIQEIGILQKKLEGTIYKINDLNSKSVKAFGGVAQSIQNYNKQLALAEKALYRVAAGSTQEARAISNYVTALGNANAVRDRQNKLIADEIKLRMELERKSRLASAGIVETTQYTQPAMPGRPDTIEKARLEALKRSGAERREALKLAIREAETEERINQVLNRRAAIQQRNKANREGVSNAIIGGAFPLLFGQGVGASVGGGLGGFAGGRMGGQMGFGLSLVGTALGGLFDQATRSAADFSKSLRAGGDAAGYLEQQLGYVDPRVRDQIKNLQASGQTARAAELAFNELASQVGVENAKAFKQLGDNTNTFASGFQRLVTTIIAGSARIDEAVKPVTDRLGALSLAVPGVNAAALTRGAIDFVRGKGQAPAAPSAKTPEAVQREAALRGEVSILQQRLQLTTVSAQTDLQAFVNVSKRVAQQEFIVELQRIENDNKKGALTLEEFQLQKTAARLKLQQSLGEIERQRIQEEQRRAEEARRAAERAAQERLQQLTTSLQLENDIRTVVLERNNVQVETDRLLKGDVAALAEQMRISEGMYALKIQILDNERQSALANAKTASDSYLINELYKQRAALLQGQQYLEQQRLIRLNNEIKLQQNLNVLRRNEEREAVMRPISVAQEQAQLGIDAFFMSPNAAEVLKKQSEQKQRLYEAEIPLLNSILQLNEEIASKAFVGTELENKQKDLENQQITLSNLREQLALLDQLELKQLKLKQVFEEYGVIINGVSNSIASALTQGVADVVSGTREAQQVFADFLRAIGDALLQYAQQAIAQYIAIGIARLFAGIGGGGGSTGGDGSGFGGGLANSFTGKFDLSGLSALSMPRFAEGGLVTRPTVAMIGEGGEPEFVIPQSKMRGAMQRYAAGARGSAVIPDGRDAGGNGGAPVAATAGPIDVRYTVERINSVDYVTADQFQRGMAMAAQQGASQGERRALAQLRQNTSARRSIGI